jgi:hypothetical protein
VLADGLPFLGWVSPSNGRMDAMSEPDVPEDLPAALESVGPMPAVSQPVCGRCDCSHPSECLLRPPAPERPSFVVVWVVGAAVVAVVLLVLVVALL